MGNNQMSGNRPSLQGSLDGSGRALLTLREAETLRECKSIS